VGLEILAVVGGGAFALTSLVVGLRLIALSRHTGEVPELAVGLALLLMGGLGYPVQAAARGAEPLGGFVRIALAFGAMACMAGGVVGIGVFNWRVFRPERPAARRAVQALAAGGVARILWQAADPGFLAAAVGRGPGVTGLELLAAAALGWAAFESTSFARRLGRRLALGLADPLVVERVRLWSLAIVAAQILNAASIAARALGVDLATWRYGGALIGPLGLAAALGMSLAFFPPARYRRFRLTRAGGRA
jgi:hypothetical protein